jgi:hypothetical protein
VVDVDPTKLASRKRSGDIRLSHIGDGVQEPAMKHDRESVTTLVPEVHLATVQPVPRARHQATSSVRQQSRGSPSARASAHIRGPFVKDRPNAAELDALQ